VAGSGFEEKGGPVRSIPVVSLPQDRLGLRPRNRQTRGKRQGAPRRFSEMSRLKRRVSHDLPPKAGPMTEPDLRMSMLGLDGHLTGIGLVFTNLLAAETARPHFGLLCLAQGIPLQRDNVRCSRAAKPPGEGRCRGTRKHPPRADRGKPLITDHIHKIGRKRTNFNGEIVGQP